MRPLGSYFNGPRARGWWVLAGKGPSFAARPPHISAFVLGLNDVCRHLVCDVAHFTDLDAYLRNEDVLAREPGPTGGAGRVILPWFPHVNNRPGKRTLAQLLTECSSLGELHRRGRLLTYNSTLARTKKAGLSTHTTRYFSAVVGLHILGAHGVTDVLTLGIDGGKDYAPAFGKDSLLSNGRPSFDVQFGEMAKIAKLFKMTVRPMVI